MTETPPTGEQVLAEVDQLDDEATHQVVAPLLEKTQFPDDDGEDAPAEPGDGADAATDEVSA